MKTYVPNYYEQFNCIAGDCKHSCCKGWEIDVDSESVKRWANLTGPVADRIHEGLAFDDSKQAHFVLTEDERCPFLNKDGLCDIYIAYGRDQLCQICTDHPRFRSYFTGRIELGLGLACEAAAALILGQKEKFKLVLLEDDGLEAEFEPDDDEVDFMDLREDLFAILQNREKPVDERVLEMLRFCNIEPKEGFGFAGICPDEIAGEQLAVYLLFRNLPDALYDGRLEDRIYFVADGYMQVRNAWANKGFADIEDARSFSERVEYNTDTWGME